MKSRRFLISLLLIFIVEAAVLFLFAFWNIDYTQNAVLVNEALQSVQADWKTLKQHENETGLEYVVLDQNEKVLYQTKSGLSESVNEAVLHRDTILDIQIDGLAAGKMIVENNSTQIFQSWKQKIVGILLTAMFLQCGLCIAYVFYLNRVIIRPFFKLKGFAERIAGGNLDVPLEMDRQNVFGAFTESFDIMRSELKKARQAEAEANAGKKELVAKLSHDIRTPVASIKAASEVGAALTDSERIRENYMQIIRKADQITALINNLFTATLEELEQLSVTPEDMEGRELKILLENADYLHRAGLPEFPDCILYVDRLRLQQVFDNIFANSYKYADTMIRVWVTWGNRHLLVHVEDEGGGVCREELPFLKEKFRRGRNTENIEGTGLGLYISDYFMKEMQGELKVENGEKGLRVIVGIPLSGR